MIFIVKNFVGVVDEKYLYIIFKIYLIVDCDMCFRWKVKCDCCIKDLVKAIFWNVNFFCKGDYCYIKFI